MANRTAMTAFFALLLIPGIVFAEVHLYLQARVERADNAAEPLKLIDVATLEGSSEDSAALGGRVIPEALYRDGYLDRREIKDLLSGIAKEKFVIHGSAVRIERIKPAVEETARPDPVVTNEKSVRFVALKNGVRVEMEGLAMKDGSPGDVIPVKLRKNKVARGIIRDAKTIELEL